MVGECCTSMSPYSQLGNFTRECLSTIIAGSCDMPFQSNSCKFVCLSVSWKWVKEVCQGVSRRCVKEVCQNLQHLYRQWAVKV